MGERWNLGNPVDRRVALESGSGDRRVARKSGGTVERWDSGAKSR